MIPNTAESARWAIVPTTNAVPSGPSMAPIPSTTLANIRTGMSAGFPISTALTISIIANMTPAMSPAVTPSPTERRFLSAMTLSPSRARMARLHDVESRGGVRDYATPLERSPSQRGRGRSRQRGDRASQWRDRSDARRCEIPSRALEHDCGSGTLPVRLRERAPGDAAVGSDDEDRRPRNCVLGILDAVGAEGRELLSDGKLRTEELPGGVLQVSGRAAESPDLATSVSRGPIRPSPVSG